MNYTQIFECGRGILWFGALAGGSSRLPLLPSTMQVSDQRRPEVKHPDSYYSGSWKHWVRWLVAWRSELSSLLLCTAVSVELKLSGFGCDGTSQAEVSALLLVVCGENQRETRKPRTFGKASKRWTLPK